MVGGILLRSFSLQLIHRKLLLFAICLIDHGHRMEVGPEVGRSPVGRLDRGYAEVEEEIDLLLRAAFELGEKDCEVPSVEPDNTLNRGKVHAGSPRSFVEAR